MAYKSLNEFILQLEAHNELIRIKHYVDPVLEIAEITDRFSKMSGGGKALLFENTGTEFPVLTNALGSYKRVCMALNVDSLDSFVPEIQGLMQFLLSKKDNFFDKLKIVPQLGKIARWLPKSIRGRGICQEVICLNPDISVLPVLKCWPADGGRFVTLPMVHTVDPISGTRNVGMYRMQILDNNSTGMHWHIHKTGARHYREYKKMNRKMPVAVALGGDPSYTYSATAPLPDGIDEYLLAGFIRKQPVKLVKCITQDIEVPSDVDIVIEGYIDTSEDLIWEGPFGDHTGFYSLEDWYPKFHITCITHRKNAVYPATVVGVPPMEDAWIAEATGKIFFIPMKFSFAPELVYMNLPVAGVAHNLTIVAISNHYPGQAFKVINSLWGAGQMMLNKVLVVINESDMHLSYHELFVKIAKSISFPDNLMFNKGPLDVLDHASGQFAFGGKIGIDATNIVGSSEFIYSGEQINYDPSNIDKIHTYWLEKGVPLILFSVKASCNVKPSHILNDIALRNEKLHIRYYVCFNNGVDFNNTLLLTWLFLSNIDPIRDFSICQNANGSYLLIDATTKTKELHNFNRSWPNIAAMDKQTILNIDKNWGKYMDYEFLPSPSLYYTPLINNEGATAYINK